jgi:hypothetical protein
MIFSGMCVVLTPRKYPQIFAVVPLNMLADRMPYDPSMYPTLTPPPPGFRGTPSYPYGHPGYFNGRGGGPATDSYGEPRCTLATGRAGVSSADRFSALWERIAAVK